MRLNLMSDSLWIYRLSPEATLPSQVFEQAFYTISKTDDELSITVPCRLTFSVNATYREEGPWRGFKVMGPLDFALTGILAALAKPLAEAGIPIFAISTYDTDYLLVKAEKVEQAKAVLIQAGHDISETA